jgi:hypothetical protein
LYSRARYERNNAGVVGKAHWDWMKEHGIGLEGPGTVKRIEEVQRNGGGVVRTDDETGPP